MSDDQNREVREAVEAIKSLFAQTEDPAERFKRLTELLGGWPDLHQQVRAMRQEVGDELRAGGMTYGEIGDLIDVTESRARHIVKGITNPSRQKRKAEQVRAEQERQEGGD
ncbi:hypothetical protein [Streptomyces murinus]|uniref:hypothetical protein n=1 Tax=Streptomyces murinus TaxID=33900 RepID=UPI0018F69C96|nr:hypothetical protein [Streptomyces murinus]